MDNVVTTSVFEQLYFGLELKIWMILFSSFLSILALLFSILDIKLRFTNLYKLKQLDIESFEKLITLMCAFYYFSDKYDKHKFTYINKNHLKIRNKNFLKELNEIIEKYKEIRLYTIFLFAKETRRKIRLLETLRNLIETQDRAELIIDKLIYQGSYGRVSDTFIENCDDICIKYLKLIKKGKSYNPQQVLAYI